MLILDKWKLNDTLNLLSHPERARTNASNECRLRNEAQRTQIANERRAAYESAYRELMDEIAEELNSNNNQETVWSRQKYSGKKM